MKRIGILGSTGSIGCQALDIIKNNPDRFKVSLLTCGHNVSLLERQIEEYSPEAAAAAGEEDAAALQKKFPKVEIFWGSDGIAEAAASCGADMILNALMGISGLVPTMAAIDAGRDIALANKETLVTGGSLVMDAVKRNNVNLLPVDSEHSAIFQCLEGNRGRRVKRILLTASGGPFRGFSRKKLEQVTLEQALNHPRWNMGRKITVDSATMMNKGFEVIEAGWLFDVPAGDVEILIHPQSIVHSMVEFEDASVIAQLAVPDMRIPIGLALAYPKRLDAGGSDIARLDFFGQGSPLTFEKPDRQTFRCIDLAYEAAEAGGSYPVALNGANEVLVAQFLEGKIPFIAIQDTLERIMDEHRPVYNPDMETILGIDEEVRELTLSRIAAQKGNQ